MPCSLRDRDDRTCPNGGRGDCESNKERPVHETAAWLQLEPLHRGSAGIPSRDKRAPGRCAQAALPADDEQHGHDHASSAAKQEHPRLDDSRSRLSRSEHVRTSIDDRSLSLASQAAVKRQIIAMDQRREEDLLLARQEHLRAAT